MEEEFNDIDVNNEILSQSYVQGISRITGSKEEDVSILHIPEEVILQRKEVWNKLFLKYSEHVSDETELDIHTFEPIEENNESLEFNYRLPMRKPSYLVQYWVDTGMPPCKALDENNLSEPESSLSEYEQSPRAVSNNVNSAEYKNIQPPIRCTSSSSSIDTAVYILSNANTTKKADTIAIMEGAKPCDAAHGLDNVANKTSHSETLIPTPKPTLQSQETRSDIHSEATESLFHKRNSQPPGPLKNNKSTSSSLISDNEKENSSDDTHTDNELNFSLISANFERLLKSPLFNNTFYNNTPQYSSNKSDILDMSFQSTLSPYAAQNANNLESDYGQETSQRVAAKKPAKTRPRRLARVENSASKNRRKLYTCRNSPVDLITPVVKDVGKLSPIKEAAKVKQSLHPALETPHSAQDKTLMIMKRAKMRARMKLKKALLSSTLGDTSQESDPNASLDSITTNDETVNNAAELREVTATERQDTTVAPSNLADTWKVLSTNINPVVRLERIDIESYKKLIKSGRRYTNVDDGNPVIKSTLTKQNLLDMEAQIGSTNDAIMYSITNCSYVEIADSDQSTIIMFRCTDNSVQSKAMSESHCNDFDSIERRSNASKNSLEDDIECENNNNSTELEDALKLKVSIEALNKLTAHQIDQEAIDDAEVSEILKHSEIRDRVVLSSELHRSEPEKISESSIKLLPRRSVNLHARSKKNRQSKDDGVKSASAESSRSASVTMKLKSSKSNVSMTLRPRSEAQINRMRKCDDDEISCTSSSISDYVDKIESIENAKRKAIANAKKLIIRLERLPANVLAKKYKRYENSEKKRNAGQVAEMPRKLAKLSKQPKAIKVTKKFLSKIRNKSNSHASENSLSCSEESSNSGVTKQLETSNTDVIKNGKINSSLSQNSSIALVTIGSLRNNVCISSGDGTESMLKSSQCVNWLPSDIASTTDDDDDIFNIVKPTRRSERRKSVKHIFNISDTSSTNSLRKTTRTSGYSDKAKQSNKASYVKKQSSDSRNTRKKTRRSDVYSSSELSNKNSGKGIDSSSGTKSTEILTVNDVALEPKKIPRNRSKTLSVLRTETGWKSKKAQKATRNRLCRSGGITSESSDKDTLQKGGRFNRSLKVKLAKPLISSDSSAVSSIKKIASPPVTLNLQSRVEKLHTASSDETSMTSNSALITARNKRSVRKTGLRQETVKSISPRRSKLPLLKNAQNTRHYTYSRVRSAPLDFTSDSTEGTVVDQKSIGLTRKRRKVEKEVLEKSIVPKNDNISTLSLSELYEKYVSSSSSDANVRYADLLPRTGSQSTESKYNSQISTTFEQLKNVTRSAESNVSLSFLKNLDNTSDESLISFSSTSGNFEKSKIISITKATMDKTLDKKSPEVTKPVVYQAITFHRVSDSDDT